MKIRVTVNAITTCLVLAVSATAQESKMDDESKYNDIFGLARAAPGTEHIFMPETEADWLIITNKIDNGQIDSDVVLATRSDDWPEKYDKNDIYRVYNAKAFSALEYNKDTGTFIGAANEGGLPSSEELNAIWQKMLEEIEQQRTEKKKAKD